MSTDALFAFVMVVIVVGAVVHSVLKRCTIEVNLKHAAETKKDSLYAGSPQEVRES